MFLVTVPLPLSVTRSVITRASPASLRLLTSDCVTWLGSLSADSCAACVTYSHSVEAEACAACVTHSDAAITCVSFAVVTC